MSRGVLIKNLAIAGFRSFGAEVQYMEKFAKVNLFIGRNNSGKSNVLRLIHQVYPKTRALSAIAMDPLDSHLNGRPEIKIGVGISVDDNDASLVSEGFHAIEGIEKHGRLEARKLIAKIYSEKQRLDGTAIPWNFIHPMQREDNSENFTNAFKVLSNEEVVRLWRMLTRYVSGGSRADDWVPGVKRQLQPLFKDIQCILIPAIRQVGVKGSVADGFDGKGIIERLAKLQNPGPHDQADRKRFHAIRDFLRIVLDDSSVEIEVPYERDTLVVHMDGKALPLEALGSGIHEVVILAAACTLLRDTVVCIEEPELHLNPILQKKLIRHITLNTDNQYFIATHSAALMDTPGAEIYHVKLDSGSSKLERVTSDSKRSSICEDLGYHPSDLLQANCVVWVEGPSDRIYLNWWIKSLNSELIEGVHYVIMFYGGRLLAHLSNEDEIAVVDDFISLRRLNRRGVILIDSDRMKPGARLNDTKMRLIREFNTGPGHAWVTAGREIENYLPDSEVKAALSDVAPLCSSTSNFGRFDNILNLKSKKGREFQASKVDVAKFIVAKFSPDVAAYDLQVQLNKLVDFIVISNPKYARST